jgi:hypothetical protein
MPDKRAIIFHEKEFMQRRGNQLAEDGEASHSSSEESSEEPRPEPDHASNAAMLKRILTILEDGGPTRGARLAKERDQPPAKRQHTTTWDRRTRSPSSHRESSHQNRQGQKETQAHRRINRCYRCGVVHFPYCRKVHDQGRRSHTPAEGGSPWNRRDRAKSVQY